MEPDLIYDIGLHNGADTAYYLHKGFRVVAIDANPVLTAAAEQQFAREIASGRLSVLNVGIAEQEGTLSFWVNEANDTQSSFNETRAKRYGPCHEIQVSCIPLSSIIAKHGIPYYMKVDIEGYDYVCVRALDRGGLPQYISVELDRERDLAAELHQLGYRHFKIVNQLTFTDSMPIADSEFALRLLRKAASKFAPLQKVLKSSPVSWRLRRTDFDSFLDAFDYEFADGCSGPFCEETFGRWHSLAEVTARISKIRQQLASGKIPAGSVWFDIHARL